MIHSKDIRGNIHSVETFGAFDGPGIRYVLFLQGCPFQCQYCHNRDTWSTRQNQMMSVEEVMQDYFKYEKFYKNGGLTVSGGEPLLQLPFVMDLFKMAKSRNIHTCLDTSAACFDPKRDTHFKTLMGYTDLVLLDIKHMDEEKHKELTGSTNQQVLAFARLLDEMGVYVQIRHVLVPSITDDVEHLKQLRSFLDTLTNIKSIEVLPYHTKGKRKWIEMGLSYPLEHIGEPSYESIELAQNILTKDYSFAK
jgi:pyruvate formate lyase activating enzyme